MALYESGRLGAAETECNKLLNLFPRNSSILTQLGIIEFDWNRIEQGIKLNNHSLQINPDQPHLYNIVGNAYQELKHFDDALSNYDLAIKFNLPQSKNEQTCSAI